MIFLIEFPDVNIFFIDVPVTTSPDFIAKSDVTENLSYVIEWWYTNDTETKYTHSGQSITFSAPTNDIDFHCYIYENDEIYDTTEILGYNFHLKILSDEINQYYRGELEFLEYSGYENFNSYSGVKHKKDFKNEGISGYSGYSGIYLPVLNIIDSENIRLQNSYDNSLSDENLNPVHDNEDDTFSLFTNYGLDPTKIEDQETFIKLQQFEQENFTLYNKKSSMVRILKPIDEAFYRLYLKILNLTKSIFIEDLIAGENLIKHNLVTLVDELEDENYNRTRVYKANAYTDINNNIYPRRCFGIVLEDCVQDEYCTIQIKGFIENFNFEELYEEDDFTKNIGFIHYLKESGKMKARRYPSAYSIEGGTLGPPVLFQEIGYPIDENNFMLTLKQPVLRHSLTTRWEDGNGGGPI